MKTLSLFSGCTGKQESFLETAPALAELFQVLSAEMALA